MTHKYYSATHKTQRAVRAMQPASRFLGPILLLAALVILAYSVIAVIARDVLWLRSPSSNQPLRIIIHHDGKQTDLGPDHPHFAPMAIAIQSCLVQGVEPPFGIQFSETPISAAANRVVTVEAFFSQPIRLRAWFDTEPSAHMLFPITSCHLDLPFVVLAQNERYLPSPSLLRTVEPLYLTLQSLGYYRPDDCTQPLRPTPLGP